MKVAVIGAGILGLTIAYSLTKQEVEVELYDKQAMMPENASSIAGGMLAPYSEIEALPIKYLQAGLRGIQFWNEILRDVPESIQNNGSLLISHTEDGHILSRFVQHLRTISDHWEWVDGDKLAALEPVVGNRFGKAVYISEEGFVHTNKVMQHLVTSIGSNGGIIKTQEVTPDDLQEAYDWVIDCRGYIPGIDKDLRGIKGEIITLENREIELNRPVRLMHPRYPIYIIPKEKNIFAVGASVIENSDENDGLVFLRSAMELMSAAYSLHPSFGEAKIVDMSSAIRPAYMDSLPRIRIDDDKKYIRCNGLFRHGYLLSPIMSGVVAAYLQGDQEHRDHRLFYKS